MAIWCVSMVTMARWALFVTDGFCYLSERALKMRVGLVWLLVLAAALFSVAEPLIRLPWLVVTSLLLVLAFRLWDDLADLEHDRLHHPRRCLVRTAQLRSFHVALWLMIAGLTILLCCTVGGARASAFIALLVAFLALYRATAMWRDLRPLRVSLVLAKYPAFVLLLSDDPGDRTTLVLALATYLLPLADEVSSTGAIILLPAAAFLGVSILVWFSLTT